MNDIYMILAAVSVLAVAFGLVFALFFSDREKSTEGENCEYHPGKKDRACCNKRKELELKEKLT